MRELFRQLWKKAVTPVICAALLLATMGMTALAATSGALVGTQKNGTAEAKLKNSNGNTRYCHVMIRASSNGSSYTTTATKSDRTPSGKTITATAAIQSKYVRGVGVIYNSGAPESGQAGQNMFRLNSCYWHWCMRNLIFVVRYRMTSCCC